MVSCWLLPAFSFLELNLQGWPHGLKMVTPLPSLLPVGEESKIKTTSSCSLFHLGGTEAFPRDFYLYLTISFHTYIIPVLSLYISPHPHTQYTPTTKDWGKGIFNWVHLLVQISLVWKKEEWIGNWQQPGSFDHFSNGDGQTSGHEGKTWAAPL